MINSKAQILDRKLEPTDNSVVEVTLRNTSSRVIAKNVSVDVRMRGGKTEGVEFVPDDRSFGTIAPGKSVTKEFAINTERAEVRDYEVILLLQYESAHPVFECDSVSFEVEED